MEKKTKDHIRNEALDAIRKWKHAGANISMGVGKTRLGLDHFQLVTTKVQKDHARIARGLVVAPIKRIHKGWQSQAVEWNMSHLLEGLDYTTYRSLNTLDLSLYDVIYLDECHSLIRASHDACLTAFNGYIIGLTGTLPHPRSDRAKMIERHCPMYYHYSTDEAIEDDILNDYKITIHLLELSEEKNHLVQIKNKQGIVTKSWYTSEKENYDYWSGRILNSTPGKQSQMMSIFRMKAMQVYKTKDKYGKKLLEQIDEKCILFANEQKQADQICRHSYHSDNKDSEANMEKFEDGTITKLSCVLQLGVGANIKGLKEIIILHAYGNSSKTAQRLGRALRLNPNDKSHIHILCFKNTIDEIWIKEALAKFDSSKITWYDTTDF